MKLRKLTGAFQVAIRAALAAGISVLLAQLCRFEHPIYALIAAVIVTDLSPARTTKLGLQRLAATVVGASCGAVAGTALGAAAWAIGLSIFVAMATCHLLRASDGAKVAGYICGIVMIAHGTHPWVYAFFRLIETSLGIGVAWLLSLVPKLIHVEEPGS
ncbi:MAG: FUSC family protein [Acidobacteriia bacterium]|nr:FUSC family protein [Terriglobia bacterium]